MRVIYEKQAIKALAKMPLKTAVQIRDKVAAFASQNAHPNIDIKTLKGVDGGYRLRQGDWRALMLVEGLTLRVTAIKSRGDVYK